MSIAAACSYVAGEINVGRIGMDQGRRTQAGELPLTLGVRYVISRSGRGQGWKVRPTVSVFGLVQLEELVSGRVLTGEERYCAFLTQREACCSGADPAVYKASVIFIQNTSTVCHSCPLSRPPPLYDRHQYDSHQDFRTVTQLAVGRTGYAKQVRPVVPNGQLGCCKKSETVPQ